MPTELQATGRGRWAVKGPLDFAAVPHIWGELAELISSGDPVTLSLGSVESANSAGLVLLLEARDLARKSGCRLSLVDVPPALNALASVSQAEGLIAD